MIVCANVNASTTIYAIWEDIPNTLKVAVLPASRFGNNYKNAATAAEVNAALLGIDADVLIITQIDEGVVYPSWWNNVDVASQIKNALADKYAYSYFAPSWTTVVGDDGAFGHLILSKYEIMESETIVTSAGSSYTNNGGSYSGGSEGRGAGRVKLFYKGSTVDVFFTHMGSTAEYNALVPAIQASTADAWVAAGNILYSSLGSDAASRETAVETALGESVNAGNVDGGINIISSGNAAMVSFRNTSFGYGTDGLFQAAIQIPMRTTYKFANWWARNTGNNKEANDKVISTAKGWDADFLAIGGYNPTASWVDSDMAKEVAKYGYKYYAYVDKTGELGRGTLLMSKYPLTEVETIVSGGRNFKRVQTMMNGKTVDIYFGSDHDETADAAALVAAVKQNHLATGNPFVIAQTYMKDIPVELGMSGANAAIPGPNGTTTAVKRAWYSNQSEVSGALMDVGEKYYTHGTLGFDGSSFVRAAIIATLTFA